MDITNKFSYVSNASLTSLIKFCLNSRPFFFVTVNETYLNKSLVACLLINYFVCLTYLFGLVLILAFWSTNVGNLNLKKKNGKININSSEIKLQKIEKKFNKNKSQ